MLASDMEKECKHGNDVEMECAHENNMHNWWKFFKNFNGMIIVI